MALAFVSCSGLRDTSAAETTAQATVAPTETATPTNAPESKDVVLLSMEENGYAHLFVYIPQILPLTRLTFGPWDDIAPVINPDGTQVVFASNRDGYWDLYLLVIQTGEITRITNTPEYESAPSWSPDGQWLACEKYIDDNLEIVIIPLSGSDQEPINLTISPASDHSPSWAPDGRHIAFVSDRGGNSDIWLADLDKTSEDRFVNLSNTLLSAESHPTWTLDGKKLAWAASAQNLGFSGIYVWDALQPDHAAEWIGEGDWPAWNAATDRLITVIHGPNREYLTAYFLDGELLLQPLSLSGTIRGLSWPNITLSDPLPRSYLDAAAQTPSALWTVAVTQLAEGPSQRYTINTLPDVRAPYPQLHDLVDESFEALRQRVIDEAGWDALAGLSNAFVPLTTMLDPGLGEDWLYTGRAFALNPLMSNAGWMVAERQDYGAQTYWKLYLRTQLQDGSQGEPLHNPPWDLAARYDLDPRTYEQGGEYTQVPTGYWIDLTSLARQYGWERVPALQNWRSYYSGARFTEFANKSGLDWYSAMLEIYPQDILVTPTRILPPSFTPTRTLIPTQTERPSRTPRPSATSTPTKTPTSTGTSTAQPTLTKTSTPQPTSTIPFSPTP